MWILVDDPKTVNSPWLGTIAYPERPKQNFKVELVRRAETIDLNRRVDLDKNDTLVGLLDLLTPCTLIGPWFGESPKYSLAPIVAGRTVIDGHFSALVSGVQIRDINEPLITGIQISSETFALWFDRQPQGPTLEIESGNLHGNLSEHEKLEFTIASIGHVTCFSGFGSKKSNTSFTLERFKRFSLTFDKPVSLKRAIDVCDGLEHLFGFLIGWRPEFPVFKLRFRNLDFNGAKLPDANATLQTSGHEWLEGEAPRSDACLHRVGSDSSEMQKVLERFFDNFATTLLRIETVLRCRHFSRNLDEMFSQLMPMLEERLRQIYTEPDEINYLSSEKRFFDFVLASDDPEIKAFSRKHIQVKDSKSPSLKTILGRAIENLNNRGFNVPPAFSERIVQRRNSQFHKVSELAGGEFKSFHEEVQVMIGILLLNTLTDLGVEIDHLASDQNLLRDLIFFSGDHD